MKKWIFQWVYWVLLVFSPAVWAQEASDKPQVIRIDATRPYFTIRLKSNPTTGFSWALMAYDSRYLQWQGHHFEAPTTDRIGAGGVEVFDFRLKKGALTAAHHGDLYFKYRRPWEKNPAAAQLTVHWCYSPNAKASKDTG